MLRPRAARHRFDADGLLEARGPEEIGSYLSRFFRQFRDYRIEVEELDELSEDVVPMEGRQFGAGRSAVDGCPARAIRQAEYAGCTNFSFRG